MKRVLVTGGLGYIGSHTVVALAQAGYSPVVLDNRSNSTLEVDDLIALCGGQHVSVIEGDIRDEALVRQLIEATQPEAVLHFAGLKAVGESVELPLPYYDCNVSGTLSLVRAMGYCGLKRLIFSSSATVYDLSLGGPVLTEGSPVGMPTHPYGRSKLMVELMLEDVWRSDSEWQVACLRYFNPVGAHPSGLIAERPVGRPNNLMPFVTQVASGERPLLTVFGNDYPTPDGTCRRDFVHVMDVAEGHVATLEYLKSYTGAPEKINLGTGCGQSVLELVTRFQAVNNLTVPLEFADRRPGDAPEYWADTSKAKRLLDWAAIRTLDDMCRDAWRAYAK